MYLCRSSRAHALLAISACILTLVLVGSTVAALDTDARPGEARQLWQWQDAGQTRLAGSPQAYVQAVDDDDGGDDDDDDDDDDDEKKKKGPFTAAYKKHVEDLLEEWRVPGVAIGVVDGEDVWTAGYGIATFPATPVTPQTIFYGASTSKAFTSSVLALMITSGNYSVPAGPPAARLAWDTPIASLIPDDFVLAADGTGNGNGNGEGGTAAWATAHLTLEDALSHRTGMPRHDKASPHFLLSPSSGAPGGHTNDTRTPATVRDITRLQRHLPLNAAPRTKWQYCNHMYVVATHVVETLTGGRSLGAVLREWIWEPLGMQGTYFSLEDALAAAARERREEEGHYVASGYSWDPRTQTFTTVELMPTDEVGGAGAVMSTVDDYTKWLRMWLRQGAPLSAEAQRAVLTPRMLVNPEGTVVAAEDTGEGAASQQPYDFPLAYALGWQVGSYRGHRFWTHSGGMHAYGAEVFFCPQLEFGFVAFGNTALTSNALELALMWDMVDDRLGVPLDQRRDWTTG
ncbi:beta-lactamase/transpeptidase-like protein, partial [Coniella lustricola]